MSTPPYLEQRSIFSYPPPPSNGRSAKEIAWQSRNNNDNIGFDIKKFPNIMECPKEIHCTMPDGLKVENRPYGDGQASWGIYATKLFRKDSVVLTLSFIGYVCDKAVDYKLIIDPEGK